MIQYPPRLKSNLGYGKGKALQLITRLSEKKGQSIRINQERNIDVDADNLCCMIVFRSGSSDHCIGIPCLQAALIEPEKATLPRQALGRPFLAFGRKR